MTGRDLTHIDDKGRAHMVDVGAKAVTDREAIAHARLLATPDTLDAIATGGAKKGDVLGVARLAGIMAAKRTGDLIPLCHPLPLTHAAVAFAIDRDAGAVWIKATARCTGRTGVEMEAMTAASVAALTIYDMCKAVDKAMVVDRVYLWRKIGGRSGDFHHPQADQLAPPPDATWL